jgi:FAD/FMN-containing dehydrogenase
MTGIGTRTAATLLELRAWLGEHVSIRGEGNWDQVRLAWNRVSDQRPAVVVQPSSAEEVVAALSFARGAGMQVAVQATGHGAGAALGNLDGQVLLQMSRMRQVVVDPGRRRAQVEAGATWEEVAAAAAPHGLAGLGGSSPNVGVAGFVLGGGVGWLSRRYGLSANAVAGFEAVLPDGRVVRADRDTEPDLYWAVRGGGGAFAVITRLDIDLVPLESAYGGFMMWPVERAADVLHAWLEWTRGASEDATTSARIMQFPPIPHVPEPLRGRSFAVIDGAILGPEVDARRAIEPIRALGPVTDTFTTIPAPALNGIHLDPEDPVPAIHDGFVLSRFNHDALDSLLSVAPPIARSALLATEVRHCGGALSRPTFGQGAVGTIAGDYTVMGVGMARSPEMAQAVEASLDALSQATLPWRAERQFPNFAGRPRPAEQFFTAADLARLRRVRATYDPDQVLHSNRPLGSRGDEADYPPS